MYVLPNTEPVKPKSEQKKAPVTHILQMSGRYLSYDINYDEKLAYSLDDIRDSDVMSCMEKISE